MSCLPVRAQCWSHLTRKWRQVTLFIQIAKSRPQLACACREHWLDERLWRRKMGILQKETFFFYHCQNDTKRFNILCKWTWRYLEEKKPAGFCQARESDQTGHRRSLEELKSSPWLPNACHLSHSFTSSLSAPYRENYVRCSSVYALCKLIVRSQWCCKISILLRMRGRYDLVFLTNCFVTHLNAQISSLSADIHTNSLYM